MKQWRLYWRKGLGRYQALPRRQQMMLAACLLLLPYFVLSTFWLDPALARGHQMQRDLDSQQTQIKTANNQLQLLREQLANDPDATLKAKIRELDEQVATLDKAFVELQDTLIPPTEMAHFLESLLVRSPSLRLVSLKTLAPTSVMPATDKKDNATAQGFDLYRHGVEIRLEGNYGELSRYVEQLEKAQRKIFWGEFELKAGEYPVSSMTLTVYTLSTDKAWIAL